MVIANAWIILQRECLEIAWRSINTLYRSLVDASNLLFVLCHGGRLAHLGTGMLISQLWPGDVQQHLNQPAGESSVTPYGDGKINNAEKTEAAAGGRWEEEGSYRSF